ncbi:MAG: thioredoxin family protein [Calditrichaeota bacterium]|nr:MAG: thioredoxin family protein [Calditrichota bacterium]MBL1203959.1 thioredoxin family protein [Calditrichota bacterium]NOG43790.1 thioredoxin family protein [Calditrichota bacterium]
MNYSNEFRSAKTVDEYLATLRDQEKLHQLHYKKAEIIGHLPKSDNLKILVITEPWCGDSTAIFPVLLKIFENTSVEIKVALRDENPDLIDQFLTKGGRAIPIFLFLDSNGDLITKFGPRPQKSQAIFEEHRQDISDGIIEKKDVMRKIRTFYAKDRGKAISEELINMLNENLKQLV